MTVSRPKCSGLGCVFPAVYGPLCGRHENERRRDEADAEEAEQIAAVLDEMQTLVAELAALGVSARCPAWTQELGVQSARRLLILDPDALMGLLRAGVR